MEPWEPRRGLTPEAILNVLEEGERGDEIKAILLVHNETSTGVTTDVKAIGRALRESGHPALLLVDSVSSLAAMDYFHDDWGIDVTISGSQKGITLPPNFLNSSVLGSDKTLNEYF